MADLPVTSDPFIFARPFSHAHPFISSRSYEAPAKREVLNCLPDLEFNRENNPGLDGDSMVVALLARTEQVLLERFSLPEGWRIRPEWVLELDSTSAEKFSRHLILQLKENGSPLAFRCAALSSRSSLLLILLHSSSLTPPRRMIAIIRPLHRQHFIQLMAASSNLLPASQSPLPTPFQALPETTLP